MALRKTLRQDLLRKLSAQLKALRINKNTKFDMGTFVDYTEVAEPKTERKIDAKGRIKVVTLEEGFCQTSACVLGYAAFNPEFNKLGLSVKVTDFGGHVYYTNGRKKWEGFDAGEKFFGMTAEESEALFNGPWTTPKQAARAIDGWLDGKYKIIGNGFYDKKGKYLSFDRS